MTENEKFLDYIQMLRKPHQKLARLRFLQPDGSTAFMLDNRSRGQRVGAFIAGGTLSYNWQNGQRRSASVTLDNRDGNFDFAFSKIWFGQEIALDEGLILSDGVTEYYIQQGVFLLENPAENVKPNQRTVTYNLVDKVAALNGTLGGNLDATYQVLVGTNIFQPIAALLAEDRGNGLPVDRVAPVFTEYYNGKTQELPDGSTANMTDAPYTLTIDGTDGTIWDVVSGLAAMVNGWVGYDETGALRIDPSQDDILDADKPVSWEFSMGEAQLLGMTYTAKNTEVYNDYICVGEAIGDNRQPSGRAQILDPRSPVDINAIGRKTIRISQAGFGTNRQCQDYAIWQVKRSAVLQRAVTISCSQILHIRGNELVTITRTDKPGHPTERHLVQGFSRPIASSGEMTINAVSVNDFPVATLVYTGTVAAVPSQSGTVTYSGTAQTPQWTNFNPSQLAVSGEVSETDVGTYTVSFVPINGYQWWDGTDTAKTTTWSIEKQALAIPTLTGSYTYDGSTQTVSVVGFVSGTMTKGGTQSAKNAGSYTATFSLSDPANYQWSDGTVTAKSQNWSIAKKQITKPTASGSFVYDGTTHSVTISGFDSATMTKTGTESAVNAGGYTITVTLHDTANTAWVGGSSSAIALNWSIAKASLAKPVSSGSYTYTGNAQTLAVSGFSSTTMQKSGTFTATNAGSYTGTVSLKDTTNYQWTDKTTAAISYPWSIAKAKLTPPVATQTSFVYPGPDSIVAIQFSGYYSSTMTAGGTLIATNVGNYTATMSLKDAGNYQWTDGTTITKNYSWKITRASLPIPWISGAYIFTYDGTEKTPYIVDYDSATMTKSGTFTATNAGSYTGYISLSDADNYQWQGGGSNPIRYDWKINKATPTKPVLSKTSISLTGYDIANLDVTRQGDGTVTVRTSDSSIVSARLIGSSLVNVRTWNKAGTARVTITVGEGTNYKAYTATDVYCEVTVTAT